MWNLEKYELEKNEFISKKDSYIENKLSKEERLEIK